MYSFFVNGCQVSTSKKQSLLRFLRDEMHLTSVKDGCSQGACGACTVLIDGETCKACVPQTDRLEGRSIITVEGLSKWESEVYTYAYGEAGAVQCGFCIPGMVMCTKGLLDRNPDPTEEEIKYALRNNYCRCTGYVKIIAAVKLAAKIMRAGKIPAAGADDWLLGSRVHRLDVEEKVLGYGKYPDDYYLDGMCYGTALRSKYPRARVLSIDTTAAKALPGVIDVFTAADIPGENRIGHLKHDQYTMIPVGGLTHYLGDAIALVAAEDMETAEKAKKLIKVEYEVLPAVHNIQEAAAEGAPLVFDEETTNVQAYKHVSRGNAEEAISKAAHVISHHFETPWTEHAFLEPECAVAYIDDDGDVMIISTDQSAYCTLHESSLMLGTDKVKCQNALVGGGFGGKEDMTVQHLAALITYLTRRPVKVRLTRAESLLIHPKRHHFEMDFTMGCDEEGHIMGVKAKVASDTGAFASLGGPVLERACTHAAGPYNYQNIEVEGVAVYTNNPPAGAFRGFGVTQSAFANESNINKLAELVGISPWEIRWRNAIEPGQELPNGQIADKGTALKETLLAVRDQYENNKYVGIACAFKNSGIGVGIPDIGRSVLEVKDEEIIIKTSAACMGQGVGTILIQIVCEATGISIDKIKWIKPDTKLTPNAGTSTASRQTLFTGEATRIAAIKLKNALKTRSLKEINGLEFYGEYNGETDNMGSAKKNPINHVAYGYATQVVILNEKGKVEKVIAAHDVGKAINPLNIEGQIEGGVVMGLGYALTEDYPLKEGVPTAKFGTLGLFKSNMVPEIESIIIEKNNVELAYGAKGVGEITCIPTAPAVQGAYYKLDGKFRTKLPLEDTFYIRKFK